MAIGTSHGEFARSVIAVSDADDAFSLMPTAFNIAEKYQISVIVLTDKQIAEGLYTQKPYDMKTIVIDRGSLVTDPKKLAKLKATDRYDPSAKDGISMRWLPGTKAVTYAAQGDEHNGDGTVDESSQNAILQIEKRMKKLEALKKALPEPELYGALSDERRAMRDEEVPAIDTLLVGWGSTKSVVLDALQSSQLKAHSSKLAYLHFTHLWPLKTEKLQRLAKKAKKVILIEGNYQGQLGMLIRQECGLEIKDKILKYDGRPFFVDELSEKIISKLKTHN
jgi:2-oxoglutarate ferredoxin oxidoreductase subunit alpha